MEPVAAEAGAEVQLSNSHYLVDLEITLMKSYLFHIFLQSQLSMLSNYLFGPDVGAPDVGT